MCSARAEAWSLLLAPKKEAEKEAEEEGEGEGEEEAEEEMVESRR